jgi:XTP/dITP diphosphohydrolase
MPSLLPQNIVLASTNQGKVAELSTLLKDFPVNITSQQHWQLPAVAETGLTFIENALIKARYACEHTGLAAIADDSGLVVPALGGEPGLYSARYGGEQGNDAANIAKLLQKLPPNKKTRAYFYCVVIYLNQVNQVTPIIAEGFWWGTILPHPQGEAGFGYDPIFHVPSHGCSAAQLAPEEKNRLSHRGQAMMQLKQKLEPYFSHE